MPKRTAHVFEDKWRSDDVKLQEAADFSSLLLSERVLKGLKKAGFKNPSPIQLEAIPVGRFGNDLVVQAKSGTGKTLVFAIIALDLLLDIQHPQVLILAPTREIAFQICDVIKSIGSAFDYFKCGAFIGGISIENDLQNIQGCQIVVGTPGRIRQLIAIKILKTTSIRLLVLDEADQLLDQSFKPDIDSIFVSLPKEKQIITTSATYPKKLKNLVNSYFRDNPFVARLNVNDLALLGIMHYTRIVEVSQMPVLAYKMKLQALEEVLTSVNFSQCLVFCNMLSKVETICTDIKSWGFSTTYISSLKEQAARLKAIECLKRFKCKVLVSSDVTSRGIDAENVDLIINIDVPYATEVYLHRVGRAGRFGSKGVAITFVSRSEMESFTKIQKDGNFKSYILPDPVPSNLINQRPESKVKCIKENEDRALECSDDETSLAEDISTNSCNIMQYDEQVLSETGDNATPIKSKVLHMNALNSLDNSNQNTAFKNDTSQQYRLKLLDNDLQHLEQSSAISKDELVNNIMDSNSSSSKSRNVSEDKDSSEHPQSDYCSNKLFASNSIVITNMNGVPLTGSLESEEADQMSLAKTSIEFSNKITIKNDSDVKNPLLKSEVMPFNHNDIEIDPLSKGKVKEMEKIFEEFKVKKAKCRLEMERLLQLRKASTKENGGLKTLDKDVIDNSGSHDKTEIQKNSLSTLSGYDSNEVVAANASDVENPLLKSEDMPFNQKDIEMDRLRKGKVKEMEKIFEEFKVKKAKCKLEMERLLQLKKASTKDNGGLKTLDKDVIVNSGSQDKTEMQKNSLSTLSGYDSNKVVAANASDVENPLLKSEDMPFNQNDIEMDPLRKGKVKEMEKIFEEFKVKKAKCRLEMERLLQLRKASTKENGGLKTLDKNVIDNSGSQDKAEIQKNSLSTLSGYDSNEVVAANAAMIKNTNVVPLTMSRESEVDQKSNNVCVNGNSNKLIIENDSDVELHAVLNAGDMPTNQNDIGMDILRNSKLKDVMERECEQLDVIGRVYEEIEDTLEINAWKTEQLHQPSASKKVEVEIEVRSESDFNSGSRDELEILDSSENLQDIYNSKNAFATAAVMIKNIKTVPLTRSYEEEASQKSINVHVNEGSIQNGNDMQVPLLNSEDVPIHPNDLEINVLKTSVAVNNGDEKCELSAKEELKGNFDKVLRQNCRGKKKGKAIDASCSTATSCKVETSVSDDEVTACVVNFIEEYEKKNTGVLNGDAVAEKPTCLTLGEMQSPISLAWDRKCLSEYYYEVFKAFKKDNISSDSFNPFQTQKSEMEIPVAKDDDEECLIAVRKDDEMPTADKMDLIQWSMEIGNMNLNEVNSDSISIDVSSDYILESTPVKTSSARNTLLDVSSETPSFINPIDGLETDDSTGSKYSNKCFQLEYTKNKNETVKENLDSSEVIESTETVRSRAVLSQKLEKRCKDITDQIKSLIEEKKTNKLLLGKMGYETAKYFNDSHEEPSSDTEVDTTAHSFIKLKGTESEILLNDKVEQKSDDTDSSTDSEVSSTNTLLERAFRAMSKNASDTKQSLPEQAAELKGVLEQLKGETPHSLQELYEESLSNIQITTAANTFKKLKGADSASNNKLKHRFLSESMLCSKGSDSECSSSIESSSKKYFKARSSSFKPCNGEKSLDTFHVKNMQSSLLSETSSSDCGRSEFPSSQPIRYKRNKRSKATKNKIRPTAAKSSIPNPRESFEGADQSNFCPNYPQSSMHVDGLSYNHQCNLESAADSIHEHSDSCSWPSQHQCHYSNDHPSCQSQLCASWYDIFYKQWNYIQNASYFQ